MIFSIKLQYISAFVITCMNHFIILAKQRGENTFGIPDDESSLDVSSPREINSPSVSFSLMYHERILRDFT